MAYDFQVTIDAADPHAQADWRAETLGWDLEPTDEDFIRRMIAEGYASDEDTKAHRGALVWKEGAAIRQPGGPDDLGDLGVGPGGDQPGHARVKAVLVDAAGGVQLLEELRGAVPGVLAHHPTSCQDAPQRGHRPNSSTV